MRQGWRTCAADVHAGRACSISGMIPLLCRPAALKAVSSAVSLAAPPSQPAKAETLSRRRPAGSSRRWPASRVAALPATTPAAADAESQAQAMLSFILGVISSLGGTAADDQPFMEAGIDSLGKPFTRAPQLHGSLWEPKSAALLARCFDLHLTQVHGTDAYFLQVLSSC